MLRCFLTRDFSSGVRTDKDVALTILNPHEARTAAALFEQLFPLTRTEKARRRSGSSHTWAGLPTSSHYTDELSAHLLCASKEPVYLEKHAFALDPYLEEPQVVKDGRVRPTEIPGTGLRFDKEALAPYRVS